MVHTKTDVRDIFRLRLLAALRDFGVPQHGQGKWLADKTGHTPKGVGKWLNGESMPQPEKWADLAHDLNKPRSYFYESLGSENDGLKTPTNSAEFFAQYGEYLEALPLKELMKVVGRLESIVDKHLEMARTSSDLGNK